MSEGLGSSAPTELAARAILATRVVDRVYEAIHRSYSLFDRARSEFVSAIASDAVLDRINELVYADYAPRRAETAAWLEHLFPWEESVVRDFFPPPPARILVGGAGSGREAVALAKLGFEIVAFDPSSRLVDAMAARAAGLNVDVRRGRYEAMDALLGDQEPGSFDAAIVGWQSFSHLRNDHTRVETLRSFARLARGPILISFVPTERSASARLMAFRRVLARHSGRDLNDGFSIGMGFYHRAGKDEVHTLCHRARLGIVHLDFREPEPSPPYAVLTGEGERAVRPSPP